MKVIHVGTIWDLDDYVYPELEEMTGMTPWNFYQIVRHQLAATRKEHLTVKRLMGRPVSYKDINVKLCCASCEFKNHDAQGKRFCCKHCKEVRPDSKCRQWQLSEKLKNAVFGAGVVRDKDSKQILIW